MISRAAIIAQDLRVPSGIESAGGEITSVVATVVIVPKS